MAISKTKKNDIVQDLQSLFSSSRVAIFTEFSGMDVVTITQLRSQIRDADCSFVVAKKSLINLALQGANIDGVNVKEMEGEVAVAFGSGDVTAIAKVIHSFAKEHEKPSVISGIVDGEVVSQGDIATFATLPSRDELLSELVGTINAPISGFVRTLNGTITGFVRTLDAIADSKQ